MKHFPITSAEIALYEETENIQIHVFVTFISLVMYSHRSIDLAVYR